MVAEIDSRIVLFTNMRLDRDTVPDGLFCYDARDSDRLDGSFAEVKPHVTINHWGTILSREAFPMNEYGSYYPEDWGYLSEDMTLEEYAAATSEQLAAFLQPELPSVRMKME